MSAETKAALEVALQAHVSDESPDNVLVTGYIMGVSLAVFDDVDSTKHTYWFEGQDQQAPHSTRGLADMLTDWAGSTSMFYDEDDD